MSQTCQQQTWPAGQSPGVLRVYPLPIGYCDDQKPHSLGHDGLRIVS
jgi:hypothetical protein